MNATNGKPQLAGQTLLVIGGSSGIGLETARRAREQGADVIITARDPERLHRVGLELGASIAAFDATDFNRLERFFDELRAPIDHVLIAAYTRRSYGPMLEISSEEVGQGIGRRGDPSLQGEVLKLELRRSEQHGVRCAAVSP
jgi:NAD(P)-dependent dehydrogenase (short-subunit alcohol dehydrogenase family)